MIVAIIVVAAVVFINEGQRRIPVQYASRVRGRRMYQGQTQYLPLKVTMAGVIPIIFAVSILLFPAQIAAYFTTSEIDWVRERRDLHQHEPERPEQHPALRDALLPAGRVLHVLLHGVPVPARPDGRLPAQERRLHPGHSARASRPRSSSAGSRTGSRSAAPSSSGFIAVLPYIVAAFIPGTSNLQLGGTSILIMVSVVVETMKQLEAQMMMRHYEGFIR